eukprot:Partr_v1_DN26594_c1_g1_i5_m3971 putative Required for endonucleolytic cleavage during polyadenylation-dependent pre-mRNA 3'-end formation (By similarity)
MRNVCKSFTDCHALIRLLVNATGCIIDTHPWIDGSSLHMLKHQVEAFHADSIIVVGLERLYSQVKSQFNGLKVVYIPKSGGVVTRDKTYRKHMQMQKVREYFYGTPKYDLSPYSSSVPFTEIAVRRIGEVLLAPSSALPLGADRKVDETELIKIDVGPVLLHTVLALSNSDLNFNATAKDEAVLPDINVAGFVYVSEVDEGKKRVHMLCPSPGKLPKRYLWLGSLRWAEI